MACGILSMMRNCSPFPRDTIEVLSALRERGRGDHGFLVFRAGLCGLNIRLIVCCFIERS